MREKLRCYLQATLALLARLGDAVVAAVLSLLSVDVVWRGRPAPPASVRERRGPET